MKLIIRALAALAFLVTSSGALAQTPLPRITTPDGTSVLAAPSVMIDHTGAEKGVSANPVVMQPSASSVFINSGSRRLAPIYVTVPNSAATYTVTTSAKSIGGLITLPTGLPQGTFVTGTLKLKILSADFSTGGTLNVLFFHSNPTGSTITDTVALLVVAADRQKVSGTVQASLTGAGGGNEFVAQVAIPPTVVDASGNIYFAFISATTTGYASASAVDGEADLLY